MNFLTPEAFVFAAALPVVVLFYLLKRKRVVKLVSSTVLWQKFLAETQASAPFQRLRHNWLLLLQLLLLLLAIFAITRPYFTGTAHASRFRVLILDASASMQSTDERPSRFETARTEALKWVDGLRSYDQMVVLQAAASTEVKQSATGEKAALKRAIQACVVTDSPTRLGEAFKLAETLIKNQPDAEIHLFSDGAIPNLAQFETKGLPLVYHKIGSRNQNLGITTLDVRANPENAAQRAVFTSVINPTTNTQQAYVELLFENQPVGFRSISIPPTNTAPVIFLAAQTKDGIFTVRLGNADDLAADNQASIFSRVPQTAQVLLITKGNRFLEKALRGAGNVQLTVLSQLTDPADTFDLVVLDDVNPVVWPNANTLAIHVFNTNWFTGVTRIEGPPIVDWKNTHPLLRYVNFDNVQIMESYGVKPPAWGIPLVESLKSPLMVAGEINRHRVVWLGFDSLQSTWPLRISFPIFIANAVEWLNPATTASSLLAVKSGDTFRLSLTQPAATALVVKPDGNTQTVPVEKNGRDILFGDTSKQGVYHLKAGTNDTLFCVNLMDAAESDIRPRDELSLGQYNPVASTSMKEANTELWRWLTLAGLCVLLFEWWYYHRRTT